MENLFSLAISYDPFEPEKDGLRASCDCEEGVFHCDLWRVFLHRRGDVPSRVPTLKSMRDQESEVTLW